MDENFDEIQMQMFELENPKGAEKLKKKLEKKMVKFQSECKNVIEKEIGSYLKQREEAKPKLNYIG